MALTGAGSRRAVHATARHQAYSRAQGCRLSEKEKQTFSPDLLGCESIQITGESTADTLRQKLAVVLPCHLLPALQALADSWALLSLCLQRPVPLRYAGVGVELLFKALSGG